MKGKYILVLHYMNQSLRLTALIQLTALVKAGFGSSMET